MSLNPLKNTRERMIIKGQDTALLDAFVSIKNGQSTPSYHYAAWSPVGGGIIYDVDGATIRSLILMGFEPYVELHQTRFANSVVIVTDVPETDKKRAKITFKDEKGKEYQCVTEPENFICTLHLSPVSTYIKEKKTNSIPEDGELLDKTEAPIYTGNTVLYAYKNSLRFGTVEYFTAGRSVKVKLWKRSPKHHYVDPKSCLVVDSNMSKNIMRYKLSQ